MRDPRAETASAGEKEYVLGTHADELARLGFQHHVWREAALAAWERAGFAPRQALLDVGCGPGYTTFDLAQVVGAAGRVVGVDLSQRFVEHLNAEAQARGAAHVSARVGDVQDLDLPEGSLDGAYARWVLCFVPDPGRVVAGVARALRPGGAFVVQDYLHYTALRVAPRSAAFEKAARATDESWRASGGDPDVVCRLPSLMQAHGLEVREIRPVVRVARPGSLLWEWPTTFFRNYLPALVRTGFLDENDKRAFEADWAARTSDPGAFFCTPTVADVIAVKPR